MNASVTQCNSSLIGYCVSAENFFITNTQSVSMTSHLSRWIAPRSVSTGVLPSSVAMTKHNMESGCGSSLVTEHHAHH